jgi:S-(hydroxymethyl)glutathione dehydrogenase/alcohol dehydrogenase
VLGHEAAGVIEEVGRDVTDLAVGDHVVLAWVANCGRCHYCTSGEMHLCDVVMQATASPEEAIFSHNGTAISRLAGIGSFAERTVVRSRAAVKIPHDVPLDRACLVGCGVMTGAGAAINTAGVKPGQTAAVFGCGGVGLNTIQGAALCGASRIIAVDIAAAKLEKARRFGATDTVDASSTRDVPGAIRALTGGLGVDHAFEAVGTPALVTQAFHATKRGGKTIVVGVMGIDEQLSVPGTFLVLEGKSIVGSLYGSANVQRDMPRLIDLYSRGRLELDELVSRRIRLDQVEEALTAIDRGEVTRSVIVFD